MRKPIKDFSGYEVDTDGNIWSNRKNTEWHKIKPR